MEKKLDACSILIKGKKKANIKRKERKMRKNRKVKVGADFSSNECPDVELISNFLKNVHEDVLLEIFLRLPNCRSAILFGSICHRWHSLISQPKFIPNFIRHHHDQQDRYSRPYTILFRRADDLLFDMQCVQPFCKLFSEESKFLHGKAATSYLDFMPSPMVIRASFDDLLLVAPGGCYIRDYYICNPLTKQWLKLPEAPKGHRCGFALVCIPNSSKSQVGFSINAQYQYKVVLINTFSLGIEAEDYKFRLSIFCSKSGKWSQPVLSCPRDQVLRAIQYVDVVTCNGILYWPLYWLEDYSSSKRMFAFDLFNDQCRVIDFPDDCVRGWQNSYGKVHLGAVCGELQLLQIFNTNEECFVMKVWELNHSTWWVLVHEINLKRPPGTKRMVGLAVHPINRNVVFMIWDKYVFQYKIIEDMYEKVDKLREPINVAVYLPVLSRERDEMVLRTVNSLERFSTFPLVHPAWPTRVPAHPSPI